MLSTMTEEEKRAWKEEQQRLGIVSRCISSVELEERKALEEGVSVLNACTESGFPDYSSFLKTFRRLYGMTPAEYRTRHHR